MLHFFPAIVSDPIAIVPQFGMARGLRQSQNGHFGSYPVLSNNPRLLGHQMPSLLKLFNPF